MVRGKRPCPVRPMDRVSTMILTEDRRVNNHATQNEELPSEQWRHVFDVNIHSIFYLTKNILPMMPWGGSIINNASINPFVGHPRLLDYTSTKGAIVGFTRALSNQIVKEKGVRVNAVCPGPSASENLP